MDGTYSLCKGEKNVLFGSVLNDVYKKDVLHLHYLLRMSIGFDEQYKNSNIMVNI